SSDTRQRACLPGDAPRRAAFWARSRRVAPKPNICSAAPGASVDAMAHIIVIGGHGKVALLLSHILSERGDQVTSVFRNPDHADDVAATGATPVPADIEQLDTAALAYLLD